jgi:hypothetical protein
LLAAIQREIKMVRKMEMEMDMGRAMEIGREMARGRDGDSRGKLDMVFLG